jgi:hypothetical protein
MACDLVPLVGADNLRVHSREVVVDVVLLLVVVSLDERLEKSKGR